MSLDQITRIEKNNPDISVNIFGYKSEIEKAHQLHISLACLEKRKHVINLLLISNEETKHYCLIKSLRSLLSSQTSKHHTHYCMNCLLGFNSEESLSKHQMYCFTHKAARIELPVEGAKILFSNYNRSMRVPFLIYADFVSFIKPISTCSSNRDKSYTNKYQKHTPSSFCYNVKCFDESAYKSKLVSFTASSDTDDVAREFVDSLEKEIRYIYEKIKFKKNKIKNQEDIDHFNAATTCHICEKELGRDKVWDQCHITGKYRGAAHNQCNINYQIPDFYPVVFHNLSGYDSHLFIKKLANNNSLQEIRCIPNNEEKYISFSKPIKVDEYKDKNGKMKNVMREIHFIDSFRFISDSLDTLSKNLKKEQCKNIGRFYAEVKLDLLLRKGVYPYDWVGSVDKFSETQLPAKESFFSKLYGEGISEEDYSHAQKVWEEFNCKTFRDYHNIYNKSDVLILADVFENFRDVCIKHYGLDPAWYYAAPGLAWDAALKITKVGLELLSDYDMVLMIQKGIRGGISMISNRYGTSNNKYMGDSFDQSKESTYIQYLDANNLYGWAMSKPLPTHGFESMSESELKSLQDPSSGVTDWKSMPSILEVDLDYPESLHDEHNDYPLAPERMTINKVKKLVPNLNDKKNCHSL